MKNSYTIAITTFDRCEKVRYPSFVVYTGTNKADALKEFTTYKKQCKAANAFNRAERSGERRKAVLTCDASGVQSVVACTTYRD